MVRTSRERTELKAELEQLSATGKVQRESLEGLEAVGDTLSLAVQLKTRDYDAIPRLLMEVVASSTVSSSGFHKRLEVRAGALADALASPLQEAAALESLSAQIKELNRHHVREKREANRRQELVVGWEQHNAEEQLESARAELEELDQLVAAAQAEQDFARRPSISPPRQAQSESSHHSRRRRRQQNDISPQVAAKQRRLPTTATFKSVSSLIRSTTTAIDNDDDDDFVQ
jgi:hypothetical protein